MITFKINKDDPNDVEVWCNTKLPVEKPVLIFNRKEEHPYLAYLVFLRLQNQMENKLQIIRQQAYEQGYKDGKHHRTRETWFYRSWE